MPACLCRTGFSLVEVMIVVVIIGLMAGIVTYATTNYLEKAKRQKARADISVYASAVESYRAEKGRYPSNQEGLGVLVPEFVKQMRNDPWGRPYQYISPARDKRAFEVVSYGADGREGGTGADADVTDAEVEGAKK